MTNEGSHGVFSLSKLAYHACHDIEREMYNELDVPKIDLSRCCELLLEAIKQNSKEICFDEKAKRFKMFSKLHGNCTAFDTFSPCDTAARKGHIDCLRIAHELGFPWDALTSKIACERGHLDCLNYAYSNGCRRWSGFNSSEHNQINMFKAGPLHYIALPLNL